MIPCPGIDGRACKSRIDPEFRSLCFTCHQLHKAGSGEGRGEATRNPFLQVAEEG